MMARYLFQKVCNKIAHNAFLADAIQNSLLLLGVCKTGLTLFVSVCFKCQRCLYEYTR